MHGLPEDEETFSAVGMALARAAPPARLRERVLASMRGPGRYGLFADRVARLFDLTLDAAQRRLALLEGGAVWSPGPVEGIDFWPLRAGAGCSGAIATFVRAAPGVAFPRHAHVAEEISFVLDGGLRDSTGLEVWRGEELYKPPRSEHSFVALGDAPCIAATVAFDGIDFAP
jgi:putative transcriptional regulator